MLPDAKTGIEPRKYRQHVIYWKQKHKDSQSKTFQDMASYRPTGGQRNIETGSDKGRMEHQRETQWHTQQGDSQDTEYLRALGSETAEEIQRQRVVYYFCVDWFCKVVGSLNHTEFSL